MGMLNNSQKIFARTKTLRTGRAGAGWGCRPGRVGGHEGDRARGRTRAWAHAHAIVATARACLIAGGEN